jgi:uncharacterized membrane protein
VGGALGDPGLEDDFVKDVGDSAGKDHSALLAIVNDDKVAAVLEAAKDPALESCAAPSLHKMSRHCRLFSNRSGSNVK